MVKNESVQLETFFYLQFINARVGSIGSANMTM